jgi:predicted RNA-binding protein YlqC (UPF0109 family)
MTEEKVKDVEFLEYVIKSIVDEPDAVKVNREVDERGVLISLDVDAKDMGMIIGRQGSTAKAIRTLLRVIGARNDSRVNLKINEPEGSERPPRREEAPAKEKTEEVETEKSIDDIVDEIK